MFECERYAVYDGGDHHILVGQVVKASFDAEPRPLALLPRPLPPVALRLACARHAPMLALDFVKANRETVERAIRDKGVDLDLDALLALDSEVRGLKTEIDELRAERNAISAQFPRTRRPRRRPSSAARRRRPARARRRSKASWPSKEAALKALMLQAPGHSLRGRAGRARRELQRRHPHRRRAAASSTSSRSTMSR